MISPEEMDIDLYNFLYDNEFLVLTPDNYILIHRIVIYWENSAIEYLTFEQLREGIQLFLQYLVQPTCCLNSISLEPFPKPLAIEIQRTLSQFIPPIQFFINPCYFN